MALPDGGLQVAIQGLHGGVFGIYGQRYDGDDQALGGLWLTGTATADTLSAGDATRVVLLDGREGDDLLRGGSGADSVIGGLGHDTLSGAAGADSLSGGPGADLIDGGAGIDTMSGGPGNDTYVVDLIHDSINIGDTVIEVAGAGTDQVLSSVTFTLPAAVENLTLTGSAAIDGRGNELANRLVGNAAANRLDGGLGADTMSGGDGSDTYLVDTLADRVIETDALAAGGGVDTVVTSVSWTLGENIENLVIDSAASVNGAGSALANVITAGAGNNVLDGAAGNDTASYLYAGAAVKASLAITTAQATGGSGSDTFTNIENLAGSRFADALSGGGGANILDGGLGKDTLAGGAGADTFRFSTTPQSSTNVDRLSDFASVDDRVLLDHAVFSAVGPVGRLGTAAFYAGTAAHDADDRIVYDASGGKLLYDADGNGAGAAVLFATVQAGRVMLLSDVWIG